MSHSSLCRLMNGTSKLIIGSCMSMAGSQDIEIQKVFFTVCHVDFAPEDLHEWGEGND